MTNEFVILGFSTFFCLVANGAAHYGPDPDAVTAWNVVTVPETSVNLKIPDGWELKKDGAEFFVSRSTSGVPLHLNQIKISVSSEAHLASSKVANVNQTDLSIKSDHKDLHECNSTPRENVGTGIVSRNCGGIADTNSVQFNFSVRCGGRRIDFETQLDESFNGKKTVKVSQIKNKNLQMIVRSIECSNDKKQ